MSSPAMHERVMSVVLRFIAFFYYIK